MVGLAQPDPHFLGEPEERGAQQDNGDDEKKTDPVFVPESEEGAHKCYDEEQ